MKLTMIYKPYTIIVVPFPFTDSMQTKKRPALVISTEQHQDKTQHISLLMITSAKHSHWYGDHAIIDSDTAGLKSPSIIRQKLFTIDSRLVIKTVGILNQEDREKVSYFLDQHIYLSRS